MSVVKIGWSGGKDSTCAVLKHIEQGDRVKAVCYIPMFNEEIPMLLRRHYEFIMLSADRLRKMGAEVRVVSGMTYYEYVTHIAKRGKNKGKPFGFPLFVRSQCGFKRSNKLKALSACDVGEYDYQGIGIAADETARFRQIDGTLKRSVLLENGITGEQAKEYCRLRGFLSPHYDLLKRDGCVLCPHARECERQMWYADYPEAVPILIDLQNFVRRERPEQTPLRNYRWFIEENDNVKMEG